VFYLEKLGEVCKNMIAICMPTC
jgi:hypothetical protein